MWKTFTRHYRYMFVSICFQPWRLERLRKACRQNLTTYKMAASFELQNIFDSFEPV